MNTDEVVADLGATVDYLNDQVTERADSMSFEDLVAVMDAVEAVRAAAAEALSLIRTEQTNQLESGARQIGTRVFARVPKRVERFDHNAIAARVQTVARLEAVDHETGEVSANQAAATAIAWMRKIYTAPSTKAKTTPLRDLDMDLGKVITKERNGFEVRITELDPGDDD